MRLFGNGIRPRPCDRARVAVAPGLLALLLVAAALPAAAGPHAPFAARSGLDRASAAARVWATDARLVYLENDEEVDPNGSAPRWGYLFHSESLQQSRAYSMRDGKIVVAENLEMQFDAPPVAETWIDSDAAIASAEAHGGREFRRDHAARVSTMLLARGTFQDGDPDPTTWTVVYTSPSAPSLFVVIDATDGKVRRSWRG
jgi:dipeptidyl aminopeptidase/acylaminoacyl peptidase